MYIALIIWLWLSCYGLVVVVYAQSKSIDIFDINLSAHVSFLMCAPLIVLPVIIAATYKRFF